MYINEQKVSKRSAAAVLADQFVLTHKTVFSPGSEDKSRQPLPKQLFKRKRIGDVSTAINRGISSQTAEL